MGTKVQCKSYLPGYPISDLHEDANYSWSRFSEDKTFSRQMHNNFKLRGVSSWLDYDKEMLKRTMLEHEAIFQRQVCFYIKINRSCNSVLKLRHYLFGCARAGSTMHLMDTTICNLLSSSRDPLNKEAIIIIV